MLDNVDGDKGKGLSVSSKWWFFGTRDELFAWLPDEGDAANFADLDSEDEESGDLWTPENDEDGTDYVIRSVRFNAIDRFEFHVNITAVDPSAESLRNFRFPDRSKLSSEENVEMGNDVFTLTPEMIGYDNDGLDVSEDAGGWWEESTACPFTSRPAVGYLNRPMQVYRVRKTTYLSGTPISNKATTAAFSGNQTLEGVAGRVVENDAKLIFDSKGAKWTEWTRSIMSPPDGFAWNSSWKDY